MSFSLRVNGEVVYKEDSQVTGIHLMTARGEVAATGISTEGVVDVILDRVAPGSPPRLDQIEDAQFQTLRNRAEDGVVVGHPRPDAQVPVEGQLTSQGIHDETLRAGGVNAEAVQSTMIVHPTKDLFDGLDPGDTDTRTARIESFSNHGDVDRCIKENPAGSGGQQVQTSEEPIVSPGGGTETAPPGSSGAAGEEAGSPPAPTSPVAGEGTPPASSSSEGLPDPLAGAGLNLGGQPGAPGDITGS